ncbi:HAD family hydrolase [Frisingicoccus sp.]|uniref:HAD family hydrolase n=1 Tax=Frisingicoccus sp. TaxID=1918627 RepID=UPI002EB280CA|nr:HAD family hydrolase [Frisingicoccus sp.]
MGTLYISDLDGTLLNRNAQISEYTRETLNNLIDKGMLFSYATARSQTSSGEVTKGLGVKLPIIVYNGTFVLDPMTGEALLSNYFGSEVQSLLDDLIAHDIYPIVYSHAEETERFTYIPEMASRGVKAHIRNRKGDHRTHPVETINQLYTGDIFCVNCIDEPEKLEPMYEKYKDLYHCIYYADIYSGEQWLEIMPKTVSKANAVQWLKQYLGCDKVVVFGDQKNDISMFEAADECYAVSNAVKDLKVLATDIIHENNEDGVAKWLMEHV